MRTARQLRQRIRAARARLRALITEEILTGQRAVAGGAAELAMRHAYATRALSAALVVLDEIDDLPRRGGR